MQKPLLYIHRQAIVLVKLKERKKMNTYTIKQAQDSVKTFYQVTLSNTIVAQMSSLEEAQEYVTSKVEGEINFDFSKTTINAANKKKIELCTSIEDELHIIVNPEENDCAVVAYTLVDGVLFLTKQWDNTKSFPSIICNEKELRKVIGGV